MNHLIAQSLQNIEDVTDGAPEPKTLSAGATPDQGAAPLVGTGESGSPALPATDFLFPLRHGWTARMMLPRDLTASEADRLAQAIKLCVLVAQENHRISHPQP